MDRIFDFHVRLGPQPAALDRLLLAMDRCGIDRAAVCAGGAIELDRLATQIILGGHVETDGDNDAVLAGCGRSGGRLLPFYFGNPHRGPDEYRDLATWYRGLEISPAVHGVPLTDARSLALVEAAAEAGHPVYVVCLARPGASATDLATLAGMFPDVRFVLGHCGFTGIDLYAINCVVPLPNVLAETSGCYTFLAQAALQRLGEDRVLFGTEYPLQDPGVELAKFRALQPTDQTWQKVAWRNAYQLLGEDTTVMTECTELARAARA